MIYRGFNIDQETDRSFDKDGEVVERIAFVIKETVAGFHWQEVGSTENIAMAMEMIDRLVMVREALAKEIGTAI